jgi:hypothetical protein
MRLSVFARWSDDSINQEGPFIARDRQEEGGGAKS